MWIAGLVIALGLALLAIGLRRTPAALPAPVALPTVEIPGLDPGKPIEVPSPSVIDGHASRLPCPVCGGPVPDSEHRAERVAGRSLRVVQGKCRQCGRTRTLHYRLQVPSVQ